jgi:hypothetical protein
VPAEGVKWYIERQTWEHQQLRAKRRRAAADEKDERALKARAERLMAELDLMERSKTVVLATELTEFIERVFGGFAAVTLGRLQRFEKDDPPRQDAGGIAQAHQKLQAALMDGARAYADQLDDEAASSRRSRGRTPYVERIPIDDDEEEDDAE